MGGAHGCQYGCMDQVPVRTAGSGNVDLVCLGEIANLDARLGATRRVRL